MYKIFFIVAILINTSACFILKDYKLNNLILSNAVLVLSFFLQIKLLNSKASDGFKVAITVLSPFFSLISFVIAVILPNKIESNFLLILLLITISIQIMLSIIPEYFTNTTKNKHL